MEWYNTITDQYVRNATIGYVQDAPLEVFNIFPRISTSRMEGLIPKYKKEDWFKIGDVDAYKRFGSSESAGDTFATESQSYRLEQYSFHKDITEKDQEQTETPYQAVNDAVRFIINRMRRVALKNLVNEFMTDGVWGNDETSPTKWDATTDGKSDANPIEQILGWKQTIEKTTGFDPNKMIVTPDCYKALRLNTHILGKLGTNNTQIVTRDILAALFDLDQLVVLNAVNEDADGYMASGKALLVYTPSQANANKYEPSAGYIMTYRMGDGFDMGTRRIPMPQRNNSLRIEADMYMDPVVPASDCGYYVSNLVG